MTPTHPIVRAATAIALGLSSPVAAQRIPPGLIPAGERVRVRITEKPPGLVSGTVAWVDSGSMGVTRSVSRPPRIIPLDQVLAIETVRHRRTKLEAFAHGAKIGAIVSGSISVLAVAGAAYADARAPGNDYFFPVTAVLGVLSVPFTVAGTLVGGTIGLANRDQWRQVWPNERQVPDG